MTVLYASIIRLHALHGGQLFQDPGQWANAAFYGIIHQVDPYLAEALHQWNGRKPFTISSLNGLPRSRGQLLSVRAGQECWLRVTILGEQLFQAFIQRFLRGELRPKIKIGPIDFEISEVLTTPDSHLWAGYTDASKLAENPPETNRITLQFSSPTGFNLGTGPVGLHYALFPLPALVFGSLASKWRDFVSPDLEVVYIEDVANEARICQFDLQTQTLHWKGRPQKGFKGNCSYELSDLAPQDRAWISTLASFAFYAGVGGKTTQGMGQCRLL
jgi:CRISPR-associated endoribonuclease Cas6